LVLTLDRDRSEWIGSVPVQWRIGYRSGANSPFRLIACFIYRRGRHNTEPQVGQSSDLTLPPFIT